MKVLVLSHDSISVHSQSNILNGNLVYLCQSLDYDADENIVECYGIGIVRSVETASDKIYLLPAITKMELRSVNVIAICNIPLPPSLLLSQSSRIGERIPYVYSSDIFIGSKKSVPNSCRPEKRMPNNHI
ncbi:hypothetical protein Bhyg_17204 [Pseudolycoriella hygida]|uniref:NOL9 C-terminal domain-containing protein n=1 Tax=Pseudolycoriella hygida TaxID=35572 RepID=A0A9Q0RTW1_9DIPT|nr:hypothetical protein Bhyg_17204 [Pseudolycoriella hygida]